MEQETPKEWVGKVLIVYVMESGPATHGGIHLQDPHIETYCGERFLVGVVPPYEKDWASGLGAAVKCDQIVNFMVFASLVEYQQYVSEAPATSRAKGGIETPS